MSPLSLVVEAVCAWDYRPVGPCCCGFMCYVPQRPAKPKRGEGRPQIWVDDGGAVFVRPSGMVKVRSDGLTITGALRREDEEVFEALMNDPTSAWSEAWDDWQDELARVRRVLKHQTRR